MLLPYPLDQPLPKEEGVECCSNIHHWGHLRLAPEDDYKSWSSKRVNRTQFVKVRDEHRILTCLYNIFLLAG